VVELVVVVVDVELVVVVVEVELVVVVVLVVEEVELVVVLVVAGGMVVDVELVVVVELVVDVVDDVGDVVVVEGGVTPPPTLPASMSSATNVPRIAASGGFSVPGGGGAHSRATTDVPALLDRREGTSRHVVVARGTVPPATVTPAPAKRSGGAEAPTMLAALFPLALTTIRRS